MAKLLKKREPLALQTRLGTDIVNEINRESSAGFQTVVDSLIAKYADTTPRTRKPSLMYNCHGLTFASRRVNIDGGQFDKPIREDDAYEEVKHADVLPGDIAIYKDKHTNEVVHSGIVVSRLRSDEKLTGPWIVSKWGGVACCRFDGHAVKLMPPASRTQPG